MLKKIVLSVAALASTAVALPAATEAHGYHGRGYDKHYGDGYREYRPRYRHRGYYRQGYYDQGYHDRGYYGRGYGRPYAYRGRGYDRGYHRRRCGSGTTGAIIGGAAGALLGREIGRGGRDYYGYRRGGGGTTGAIVGGAAGALLGREIGRSC